MNYDFIVARLARSLIVCRSLMNRVKQEIWKSNQNIYLLVARLLNGTLAELKLSRKAEDRFELLKRFDVN